MHPPTEKSPLLTRIGIPAVNIIPFPQIITPASTHQCHPSYSRPLESPRSPLSPPASILIESRRYLPSPATSSASRRGSSWMQPSLPPGLTLAAFTQASLSGAASLVGWDMMTGCILYAPNDSLHLFRNMFPNPTSPLNALGMTCNTSSVYGILLSVILTTLSSLVYFRSQHRSKSTGGPSFKANFATFVMTPMACLLAAMFTALVLLTDVRANIGTVCHLGSALCTSVGVIVALLM